MVRLPGSLLWPGAPAAADVASPLARAPALACPCPLLASPLHPVPRCQPSAPLHLDLTPPPARLSSRAPCPLPPAWNCPYQLSHPDFVANTDTPADATVDRLPVSPGDVLVAGTDGLWDNMWDDQLLAIVGAALAEGAAAGAASTAAALAGRLAEAAAANAADPRYRGPWAVELEQHQKVGRHTGAVGCS